MNCFMIQDFLNELDYHKPIMVNDVGNEIYIYCKDPGILIGKAGEDIDRLEKRLGMRVKLFEVQEIVCGKNAKIDTRPWSEIEDERIDTYYNL